MCIDSLYVDNFKNFTNFTISKLARINLIVGKNNVGKSTLLEAISIYLSNGSEEWLRRLLASRGESIVVSRDEEEREKYIRERFLSLFKDRREDISKDNRIIIGVNMTDSVVLSQVYLAEQSMLNVNGDYERKRLLLTDEDLQETDDVDIHSIGLQVTKGKTNYVIPFSRSGLIFNNNIQFLCPFQYVHTSDFDKENNAALFDKVSLSPEEDFIIQALHIINKDIRKINFLDDDRRRNSRIPVVSLEGEEKRQRLSSMGDGINRILTIILSLLNCKNGVLLLDEFETGLHYSVQKQLWEIIFYLAEKLNIQVFVTTHSNDCIRSFSEQNKEGQGMLVRLEQRNDRIVSVVYDNGIEISYASDNDIELR